MWWNWNTLQLQSVHFSLISQTYFLIGLKSGCPGGISGQVCFPRFCPNCGHSQDTQTFFWQKAQSQQPIFLCYFLNLQILKANDIGKSALLLMYLFLVLSDHVKMNHSLPTQTDFQLLHHAAWHESTSGNPSAFTS
ncbi:hypothetical protein OS493_004141 [Desmophyllum pertusum]|uniref:Uncharacterized protein n=1 Tax=Desmophyllum pertusum TaxID=174260 RepID=A0A9W9ZTL2_9CNID|nr:hypothetical protein OS493_004141 [Desmophyllum pertusum]